MFEIERKGNMVNIFTPFFHVYVWRPGQPFGIHVEYGLPYSDWRYVRICG